MAPGEFYMWNFLIRLRSLVTVGESGESTSFIPFSRSSSALRVSVSSTSPPLVIFVELPEFRGVSCWSMRDANELERTRLNGCLKT